jgi:hypothetical protein
VRYFIITLYTGCLKIHEFRIQSVVGDHFSSPNMEIKKKKSGLPPQRYNDLKVHSLKCVFFKYRLKSSVFVVIYAIMIVENNNVKQFFQEYFGVKKILNLFFLSAYIFFR